MAARTDKHSPALHVADGHDLIRVQGARGAHRYSPKCPEGFLGTSPVCNSQKLVLLFLREANNLGYEVRLGICVRDPVLTEAVGDFVLEAGVPFGDLGVCPQVVAEEDVAVPERGV